MTQESISRILVVDDEERIRKLLRLYLEKENFEIDEASNGEVALEKALNTDYTLILLDVMMPVMDGIEVCMKLRETKNTPILMLSAMSEENSRLQGFEVGVDDYVVKPFSPREVVLRVKALLRRVSNHTNSTVDSSISSNQYVLPYFTIDEDEYLVTSKEKKVQLSPKEYRLLFHLARQPDKVFSREDLLRDVWQYEHFGDLRTVDTHIKRLRWKLSRISIEASNMISTVWGIGYKLVVTN